MKKDDKASISLKKVIAVSVLLLFIMGIAVMAVNSKLSNVKIIFSNGEEMNVLTLKTNISEILEENHIVLLSDEMVIPSPDKCISDNKTIRIVKQNENIQVVSEIIEKSEDITAEKLLAENYESIVEKIITEKVVIEYETIKNDISTGVNKKEVVLKKGVNGLKEVVYKVKYKGDIEVERIQVSEDIIKTPVDKIIEIRTSSITSRGTDERVATINPAQNSNVSLATKVAGITPTVRSMNTSGYCSCVRCCGKTNGVTASGEKVKEWYTIAAGQGYPIGTVIYIPYFENQPNGGWFVVQDRGGAISNKSIDVYFGTHSAALQFGRKNLECYIYEF